MGKVAKRETNSLRTESNTRKWQGLKIELRREIDAIFAVSGESILIEPLNESGSELMLRNRSANLKLKDVPNEALSAGKRTQSTALSGFQSQSPNSQELS
jgi:hypothetical protein